MKRRSAILALAIGVMIAAAAMQKRPATGEHVFRIRTRRGRQTPEQEHGMFGDAERRALRRSPRRLGERRRDAQIGGVERQGAAAQREGQGCEARACHRMNHESPGKQKGRAAGCGAPQSYCVLHPDGSLESDMRSNTDDPAGHPADLL